MRLGGVFRFDGKPAMILVCRDGVPGVLPVHPPSTRFWVSGGGELRNFRVGDDTTGVRESRVIWPNERAVFSVQRLEDLDGEPINRCCLR